MVWSLNRTRPAGKKKNRGKVRASGSAILRTAKILVILVFVVPPLLILLFRVVPPPLTPLMLIRQSEGISPDYRWRPLELISAEMLRAVVAAEDGRFCSHWGVDLTEANNAVQEWLSGERLRGASTLSMQTTKNLFLWPGRNVLRKGIELWLTLQIELLWPKKRIMEVYLNIAEMGPGLYGVEAAAKHYFNRPASDLTKRQAALIAAALPNPKKWSPAAPTAYLWERAGEISARAASIDPYIDCIN